LTLKQADTPDHVTRPEVDSYIVLSEFLTFSFLL